MFTFTEKKKKTQFIFLLDCLCTKKIVKNQVIMWRMHTSKLTTFSYISNICVGNNFWLVSLLAAFR